MRLSGSSVRQLLVIAGLLLPGSAALACAEPPERAEYAIHHETYGEVGRHVITFSCAGDELIVETAIEGEVKVLMVPLFQRDGTLSRGLAGRPADRLRQPLRRQRRGLRGARPRRGRADGDRRPRGPDRGAADRRLQPPLEPRRDRAHAAVRHATRAAAGGRVTPAGTETITVGGRTVEAQKYRITGDLERELWYDEDGTWLQSRLEHDGAKITLTRRSLIRRAGLCGAFASGQH